MAENQTNPASVVVVTTESQPPASEESSQERQEAVELGRLIESNHSLSQQVAELSLRVETVESRQSEQAGQLATLSERTQTVLEAVEVATAEAEAEAETETATEEITPPEPEPEPESSEPEAPKITAPKWARMLLGAE